MGWQDAPLASVAPAAPASQPAWMAAPVVQAAAEGGVPNLAAAQAAHAAYEPPTAMEKARGAIEAAIGTAREVAASIPAMAGAGVGFLGGLMHDLNVATTPGASPDQYVDPTAAGERMAQGVHDSVSNSLRSRLPLPPGINVPNPFQTSPTGEDYTRKTLEAAAPVMAAVGGHFPTGEIPGAAAAGRATADAAGRAGAAVKAAPGAVTRGMLEKVMPKPDPEMLKTATLATDKFPDIQVPPDRLTPKGSSTRATLARETSDLPGAGGDAHEFKNREAITRYAIRAVDHEDTLGRLKPETLDPAMDKAFAKVKKGYQEIGPQGGNRIGKLLDPERESAARTGSDEAVRIVDGHIKELLDKADPATGMISPTALQKWDSRLGLEARGAVDRNLARRLSDLQDIVREHVEKQVSPATAADMRLGRSQYATGIELYPIARQSGTINSGIINDPGDILRVVTDDRNGKVRVARGASSDLIDLAKVADLVKAPTEAREGAAAVLHAGAKAAGAATVVGPLAGRVYNKQGPKVTRMLVEKGRPAPEAPAAPAPAPLALPYDPNVSPSGGRVDLNPVAVTPEGQAIPPGLETARDDLAVSQRNAGGTGRPPLATTYADYDLNTPEFQPPAAPAPAATPPSELAALDQQDFQPAPSRGERELPSPSFPHEITEPDTAPVMVSGEPGETAATDAAGRAMQSDDAALARQQQTAPPPAAPAPPEPKVKPNPQEQIQLDEIDRVAASTTSDAVKTALRDERRRVMKDVAARHASEAAQATAQEMRAAAAQITDPRTKQAMLARADKIDPPPRTPEEQAAFDAAHPRGEGGTFISKKEKAPDEPRP